MLAYRRVTPLPQRVPSVIIHVALLKDIYKPGLTAGPWALSVFSNNATRFKDLNKWCGDPPRDISVVCSSKNVSSKKRSVIVQGNVVPASSPLARAIVKKKKLTNYQLPLAFSCRIPVFALRKKKKKAVEEADIIPVDAAAPPRSISGCPRIELSPRLALQTKQTKLMSSSRNMFQCFTFS